MTLESNWPYKLTTESSTKLLPVTKALKFTRSRLPLGVKLFRFPSELPPPVLSHHFVAREDINKEGAVVLLDSIREAENEDTLFGMTPKINTSDKHYRNKGLHSPLSRFASIRTPGKNHPLKESSLDIPH